MALILCRSIRFNTNFTTLSCSSRILKHVQHFKRKSFCNSGFISPLVLEPQRNYSLAVYSQHVGKGPTFRETVSNYIKSRNNLPDDLFEKDNSQLSNIFDTESAIKQLESVILHSLQAHPGEVIKLFSLYKSSSKAKLYQTHVLKQSSKLMELKIQTAILAMTFDQLYHFSIALKNIAGHKLEFLKNIEAFVFEDCLTRAEGCQSISEVIQYFMITYHLFGVSVSKQKGYFQFMTLFQKHIDQATPSQLCHILYFSGFSKKKNDTMSEFQLLLANSLLSKCDEISFVEFGLAINGLFRLNLKINSDVGVVIKKKLLDVIDQEGSNTMDNLTSYAFVSLVKYLRFIVYKDKELVNAIKTFIEHLDEGICNPQFVSHIISLYANSNFYEPEVYSILSSMFFKHLRSSSEIVRIKDVSRVIWALSHAQHKCSAEDLELLENSLHTFCSSSGEFLTHVSHAVDSTLYLASLDVYSEKLMKLVLQPEVLETFKKKEKSRYISRLLVLHEVQKTFVPSLEINLPTLIAGKHFPFRNMSKEFQFRPSLDRLQGAADWLRDECRTKVFNFRFLVPHINYCSMVFCNSCVQGHPINASEVGKHVLENLSSLKDTKLFIDVNDINTTLNDGERVNGLETLKRKLLRKKGWDITVLSEKDIEMCGNDVQAIAALILKSVQ